MNKEELLKKLTLISVEGKTVKDLYGEISAACMEEIVKTWDEKPARNAYYLSVEFLMGRMFFNNLMELGVLNEVRNIFAEKGFDLNRFEEVEDAEIGRAHV